MKEAVAALAHYQEEKNEAEQQRAEAAKQQAEAAKQEADAAEQQAKAEEQRAQQALQVAQREGNAEDIAAAQAGVVTATTQVAAAQETVERQNARIRNMEQELARTRKVASKMESDAAKLQGLRAASAAAQQRTQQQIEQISRNKNAALAEVARIRAELAAAEERAAQRDKEEQAVAATHAMKQGEADAAAARQAEEDRAAAEEAAAQRQQEADASAIRQREAEADVEKLKAELSEAQQVIGQARGNQGKARAEVARIQRELDAAREEATRMEQQAKNAAAEASVAAQRAQDAVAQSTEATAQLAAKNSELASQRRNAEALAAQHTQSLTDLAEAHAKLEELQAQGAAASMADVAEREAAEARVRAAEQRAKTLAAERNQSRAALLQAKINATSAQEAAQLAAQQQIQTAQANVQRLQTQLEAAQQAAQQKIAEISGNRNAAQQEIANIKTQLEAERAAAETLLLAQAEKALRQQEEDRKYADAVATELKQNAEKAAQEAAAAAEAQRVANEEVQQLRAQLEAASQNTRNKSATHESEIARMSEELREAQAHAAQQGVEAAAAAAAQKAAALLETEAAVAAARAAATEEAAAAALVAQQKAAEAQADAVAAAQEEAKQAAAEEATRQLAAQAEAAQQEAQQIQAEADARVASLTSELDAVQQEAKKVRNNVSGNRAKDRADRNAARAELERITKELEDARTESAEAQEAAAATLAEREQAIQAAEAARVAAEAAQVAAEEARVEAEAAKEQAEEVKKQAEASAANALSQKATADAQRNAAQKRAEEVAAAAQAAAETQAQAAADANARVAAAEESVATANALVATAQQEKDVVAKAQAEAAAHIAQLESELETNRKAMTNLSGVRAQSNSERNAARKQVEQIQFDLEAAKMEAARVKQEAEIARQKIESAVQEAEAAKQKAEVAEAAALNEKGRAEAAQTRAEAAQKLAEDSATKAIRNKNVAAAEKNAAQKEAAAARQEQEAARAALAEAEQRKQDLERELTEAKAQSEAAAAAAAQQSTNATQAQQAIWNQQAATAAAAQADIQAKLAAATARATELTNAHKQAIQEAQTATAAASAERNTFRQRVTALEKEQNRIQLEKQAQQLVIVEIKRKKDEEISELKRSLAEKNAAVAATRAELEQVRQAEAAKNAEILLRQKALNEKTQLIEERNEQLRVRNAANEALRAQHAAVIAEKESLVEEANKKAQRLLEEHKTAIEKGDTQHEQELREKLNQAQAVHAAAMKEQANASAAALTSAIETAKKEKAEQDAAFSSEKATLQAQTAAAESARVELEKAKEMAIALAQEAEEQKEKALAEAERAQQEKDAAHALAADSTAKATAAIEAEQKAAQALIEAKEEERVNALAARDMAQKVATNAIAEREKAKKIEEDAIAEMEKAKEASTQASAQALAALAEKNAATNEAAEAKAQAENAIAIQKTLLAEQIEMKQKETDIENQLIAVKEAQERAEKAVRELERVHKDHLAQSAQQRATNQSSWAAEKETLQRKAEADLAIATAERQKVEKLEADLAAQTMAHEAAIAEAMEKARANAGSAIEHARAQIEEKQALETEVKELQNKVEVLTKEKDRAVHDYEQAQQTIEQKMGLLANLNESVQKLTLERDALKGQARFAKDLVIGTYTQAISDAQKAKTQAEAAFLEKETEVKTLTTQLEQVIQEKNKIQSKLEQMAEQLVEVHSIRSQPPVSRNEVQRAIDDLMNGPFMEWRTFLRQPTALRVLDLLSLGPSNNSRRSARDRIQICLQANPIQIMFSPLPDESIMQKLLKNTYQKYKKDQDVENGSASSSSSSSSASSSTSGENAMRIDFLLYYLILALRDSRMNNTSSEFVAIKTTIAQIAEFTQTHIQKNRANLIELEKTCKLDLIDEHHQDQPLLTFLYLSSKNPTRDHTENDRFVYEIDESNQSLTMTYDSTPKAFYQGEVRTQEAKTDPKTYRYGPFTKIYDPTMNSRTISHDQVFMDAVENRLRKGEAVTVIGYGASGSGKTTTLVYAKHSKELGLLAHVANRLIPSQAGDGFTSCNVVIYELDADITPLGENNGDPDGQCRVFLPESAQGGTMERTVLHRGRAQTHTLHVGSCSSAQSFSYKVGKTGWVNSAETSLEVEIVDYIDTKRNTAPTPNNPQSSRSHVICVLTFSKGDGKAAGNAKGDAVFIVCDFAGVENTFMCGDPDVTDVIGNDALIESSIQNATQEIKKNMNGKGIINVPENSIVLRETVSSYLFGSDRRTLTDSFRPSPITSDQIMGHFIKIGKERNIMYNILITIYKGYSPPKTLPTIDQLRLLDPLRTEPPSYLPRDYYKKITFSDYGHGMGNKMAQFSMYVDSYMRILDLYRNTNSDQTDEILYSRSDPKGPRKNIYTARKDYDLRLDELLRILIWHIQNPVRYQALFQSLMTLTYQPAATTAMTNSQIREHLKGVMCDQRVKEGVFINRSLAQLRSFISASVRNNPMNRMRTPPFLDECVPLQCDPQYLHCIGQGSSHEEEDGGPLARLIETSRREKNNTFCIFTVVNLSRDANNPPPIPYVDISPLLTIQEAWQPLIPTIILTTRPTLSAIDSAIVKVQDQMKHVGLQGTLVEECTRLRELIRQGYDIPRYLEELIQQFISHNAITTIGTIEFTDAMAKYGATQITCSSPVTENASTFKEKRNRFQRQASSAQASSAQASSAQASSAQASSAQASSAQASTGSSSRPFQPLRSALNLSKGGRMPTRVRRKANRRTRKKRTAQ